VRRNVGADDVERGVARAEAGDDDAASRQSVGARVWRRCMVVVFSGRAPRGGRGPVEWSGAVELQQASNQGGGEAARRQSGAPASAVHLGGRRACDCGGVLSGV
jgi:hypothetical protein